MDFINNVTNLDAVQRSSVKISHLRHAVTSTLDIRWDVSKDALEQNVGDVQVVAKICPMKDIPYVYCK